MAQLVKRLIDIVVSTSALILLGPLFAIVAMWVRLDSAGPILFRQSRLGRGAKQFSILKFRTMQDHAPDVRNPDGSAFSSECDPRVTRIGRWLRLTSLDELPQLWNVLRGDMSLVGPRPDQADQIEFYSGEDHRKLAVRPGITGLAQISGRNRISWAQRRLLDREYVARWSLSLDIAILLRTIPYVLLRQDIHEEKVNVTCRTPES